MVSADGCSDKEEQQCHEHDSTSAANGIQSSCSTAPAKQPADTEDKCTDNQTDAYRRNIACHTGSEERIAICQNWSKQSDCHSQHQHMGPHGLSVADRCQATECRSEAEACMEQGIAKQQADDQQHRL